MHLLDGVRLRLPPIASPPSLTLLLLLRPPRTAWPVRRGRRCRQARRRVVADRSRPAAATWCLGYLRLAGIEGLRLVDPGLALVLRQADHLRMPLLDHVLEVACATVL